MGLFGSQKRCPKCDSKDINIVKKKNWMTSALRGQYFQELFNRSKDLYVCRNCGFSWEER